MKMVFTNKSIHNIHQSNAGLNITENFDIIKEMGDITQEIFPIFGMHTSEEVIGIAKLECINDKLLVTCEIIDKTSCILIKDKIYNLISIRCISPSNCIDEIALTDSPFDQMEEDLYQEKLHLLEISLDNIKTLSDLNSSLFEILNDSDITEKARICKIDSGYIEIYPNDHNPPHFHFIWDGKNNKFTIDKCEALGQNMKLPSRIFRRLQDWHKNVKPKLLAQWNATRPSN